MSLEKKLKQKRNNLQTRLEKEPYPQTNLDSIILQAGISLLNDVLEELGLVAQQIREMKAEISDDVQSCCYLCRENKCPLKKIVLGLLVEQEGEK